MSFSLKISTASFSNFVDKTAPYLSEAAGLWLMGTEAESRKNLVTGVLSTVIGVPVYGSGIATLSVTNGFDTGIVIGQADPLTIISVGSTVAASYAGTWHSGTSHAALYGTANFVAGGGSSLSAVGFSASLAISFKAGTTSGAAGVRRVYARDATAMLTNTTTAPQANIGSNTFRIAANTDSAVLGSTPFPCAATMVFKKEMTASQIAELYDYLKFKLGKRGVVVL